MRVNLSDHFKRAYKRLPRPIQDDFQQKIRLFMANPRDRSLRTHKLKGKLQESLAFRLKDGHRVLFEYVDSDQVDLLDVGPHDIYKKR